MSVPLPQAWRGFTLPGPDILTWAKDEVTAHVASEDFDEGELSTRWFPLCGTIGGVRPHIDEFGGQERGKSIFGLVLHADNHELHTTNMRTVNMAPIRLEPGMLYRLDPHDRHWTNAPPTGMLVFVAAFIAFDDPRYYHPDKLAHDLFWETCKAYTDSFTTRAREKQEEHYRYAGVQPVAPTANEC